MDERKLLVEKRKITYGGYINKRIVNFNLKKYHEFIELNAGFRSSDLANRLVLSWYCTITQDYNRRKWSKVLTSLFPHKYYDLCIIC